MALSPPRVAAAALLLAAGACAADEPRVTDDLGDAPACAALASWPAQAAAAELALLDQVNLARAAGATCGDQVFPPALPLDLSPQLRCAARMQAGYITASGQLSHQGDSGSAPIDRAAKAGYDGLARVELLAANYRAASEVARAWLTDPAHCAALLAADDDEAGPGALRSDGGEVIAWVLVTGERDLTAPP